MLISSSLVSLVSLHGKPTGSNRMNNSSSRDPVGVENDLHGVPLRIDEGMKRPFQRTIIHLLRVSSHNGVGCLDVLPPFRTKKFRVRLQTNYASIFRDGYGFPLGCFAAAAEKLTLSSCGRLPPSHGSFCRHARPFRGRGCIENSVFPTWLTLTFCFSSRSLRRSERSDVLVFPRAQCEFFTSSFSRTQKSGIKVSRNFLEASLFLEFLTTLSARCFSLDFQFPLSIISRRLLQLCMYQRQFSQTLAENDFFCHT